MSRRKLGSFINYRIRVVLDDGRAISGTFLAFDKHMNLCISDAEEFRTLKIKSLSSAAATTTADEPSTGTVLSKQEKRALGFVLVRGECVVSLVVEGPPPRKDARKGLAGVRGTGVAHPTTRDSAQVVVASAAPMAGLSGPAKGVGVPSMASMAPSVGMPPMPPGMQIPPGMPPMPPMPPGMKLPPGMPPMPPMPPGMQIPPGMPPMPPMPPGMKLPPGMPPMPPMPPGMQMPPGMPPMPPGMQLPPGMK